MLKTTLAALTLILVAAGCGGKKAGATGDDTNLPSTPTELAAYAGNARYPDTQPVLDQLRIAAIVSRDNRTIKLYNFGSENIRNVDVWVNGSYVKRIGGIAPQSRVTIDTTELYNGLGRTLARSGDEVSLVQLQKGNTLYNLLGPVAE